MAEIRRTILVVLAISGLLVAGSALAADPEIRQLLAPSGKLRVGLYPGTPTSILPDTSEAAK